jgi:hypothetical protein
VDTWYNNDIQKPEEIGYIFYQNKLLGVPRLRQIRVRANSCVVHEEFESLFPECYDSYSDSSSEDTKDFGPLDEDTVYTAY